VPNEMKPEPYKVHYTKDEQPYAGLVLLTTTEAERMRDSGLVTPGRAVTTMTKITFPDLERLHAAGWQILRLPVYQPPPPASHVRTGNPYANE
jgi:hypothetical protein